MNDQEIPGTELVDEATTNQRLVDPVRLEDKDEFYHDILGGLSVFMGSSYVLDIMHATREYPILRLGHSLNPGQVRCKKWLLDMLSGAGATEFSTVYILGGWYGVLGAMLLHDPRFNVDRVVSVDIEPSCRPIAEALNRSGIDSGRFSTMTADIYDLDYESLLSQREAAGGPDLLINTSCEHLAEFDRWFERVPEGTLAVLQSNDYFGCDEHFNCVPDLATFSRQAPLSKLIYEGELKLKKYTRFMRIGNK
jgi:hypothetical protein